jgi:hypothetical protein
MKAIEHLEPLIAPNAFGNAVILELLLQLHRLGVPHAP